MKESEPQKAFSVGLATVIIALSKGVPPVHIHAFLVCLNETTVAHAKLQGLRMVDWPGPEKDFLTFKRISESRDITPLENETLTLFQAGIQRDKETLCVIPKGCPIEMATASLVIALDSPASP